MKPDKIYTGRSTIRMYNADCMELMQSGKTWDLAIVDPPYGVDIGNGLGIKKGSTHNFKRDKTWEFKAPDEEYFNNLFKASHIQIIWGANHFNLPISKGWIFWDKCVPNGVSFSDGELAWTNLDIALKKVTIPHSGFTATENKIHPTQKPVKLYKWLLTNYAKQGDTILDTHGGSMSIAIACWDLGFDLDICELDSDYFDSAVKRFESHIAQTSMF